MTTGTRPDLTPAQLAGLLVAGIPILSTLLAAFGVFTVSPEQQDALGEAVTWGGVTAGALFAGDAGLRAARNAASAKTDAAAMYATSELNLEGDGPPLADDEVDAELEAGDLPSDDAEQLPPATPPDREPGEPAVVQPSQTGDVVVEQPRPVDEPRA